MLAIWEIPNLSRALEHRADSRVLDPEAA